jgi:hypothetical protein
MKKVNAKWFGSINIYIHIIYIRFPSLNKVNQIKCFNWWLKIILHYDITGEKK